MSRDSLNEEWIFVVKQGVCRILKTMKLSSDLKNKNKVFVEITKLFSKDVFVSFIFNHFKHIQKILN